MIFFTPSSVPMSSRTASSLSLFHNMSISTIPPESKQQGGSLLYSSLVQNRTGPLQQPSVCRSQGGSAHRSSEPHRIRFIVVWGMQCLLRLRYLVPGVASLQITHRGPKSVKVFHSPSWSIFIVYLWPRQCGHRDYSSLNVCRLGQMFWAWRECAGSWAGCRRLN